MFREHAALSAFENGGTRDFDLGGLAGLSDAQFDTLDPVQWPAPAGQSEGKTRFFADGGFFTPDRKARFIARRTAGLAHGASAATTRCASTPAACATSGTP